MSLNPNGASAGYYFQTGATAYLIDPAGTYSLAGASAPTTDPAGTYSGAGASTATTDPAGTYSDLGVSAPTLAAPGTYIPVIGTTSAAAEIVDPAGTYSPAGASAPTTDPAGAYSGRGASARTLAAASAYIPGTGATSAAAEVVDPAGASGASAASAATADQAPASSDLAASPDTIDPNGAPAGYYYQAGATAYIEDPAGAYSLAGATTPTADPGGTTSAPGASAPTQDPAGTYSSPYALNRLLLDPLQDVPFDDVLSFSSATAVANYFGASSNEAAMATEFFSDYGSSATLSFARYPILPARAHLYGTNVSNLTLSQLRAINGSLSTTSEGYNYSGTVNLSGVASFSAAATAIQNALNANLPVAATTTGSSISTVTTQFTASITGAVLTVTGVNTPGGSIQIGSYITGANGATGQITAQLSGTPNGAGEYSLFLRVASPVSSEIMTETYGVLTVGNVTSGTVAVGQQVTDATGDVPATTAIEANLSGSGDGSQWVVNNDTAVAAENMTMTGAPLTVTYTALTGDTANRHFFEVQQNGAFNWVASSLTYMGGTAAGALGLTQASGAFVSSPNLFITNVSAWMTSFVQNYDDQFSTFQTTYNPAADLPPGAGAALEAWAASTDGQYQYLTNSSNITPPAGTSTATIDPAGTYSGPGASLPTPAPAGAYIPGAGATSAAAEIVDPAGTYSLSGASAPTADPAGTYSSAGASAPTQDPAGTYTGPGASAPTPAAAGTYIPVTGTSPSALDRLVLDNNNAIQWNEALSFNSAAGVANFFGASSFEANLATDYFSGYSGSSANLLFARVPLGGGRGRIFGSNIRNLTLAELQSINGTLSITSQGYPISASINLSSVTSFSAAATAIQSALNAALRTEATTTGSSIVAKTSSFTGSIAAGIMNVSAIQSGIVAVGGIVSVSGYTGQVINQISGTQGGVGQYGVWYYTGGANIPSETLSESYGLLTIGAVSSGTVAVGEQVTGTGVAPDTAIEYNLSGSGSGSTWVVQDTQSVASESITMTAAPLQVTYNAVTGATVNSGTLWVNQNGSFPYSASSMTYASGTAAAALGLSQSAGAYLSTPGELFTTAASMMNNIVGDSSEWSSFQTTFSPDSSTAAGLWAWAQSTSGQFQYLENYTSTTPPIVPSSSLAQIVDPAGTYSLAGASAPTTDPAGTYSSAGASAPTQDPAGTFSPAGASAPMLAAAGTYIPGAGATSSAAELVDPAGTYSGAGASGPTPADPGTYIPVAGATSAAAEIVDSPGSYSLAGASAPTLAQPGYYVPTAGASSETPDDPGYYTPYAGATAEILALPPVISGTEAGQSTPSGQSDTPFGFVTITDPNIDTSDSLSIQLTGSGGALTDGAGFSGLTTSASGLYILSGTAAAITSELDALVFAPSAGSGTTTLTLTDATSVGTSASDATTTVTSTGLVVVSVSTFLADQSTLDQTAGGFDILDAAGAITANLDQLDDPNIDAITISDNGQVGASVQQLTIDAMAIGKLQNASLSPVLLAISDTAGAVEEGLSTLAADTGEIASIAASGGPVVVSTSTFLADQSTLDQILGGFAISDAAAAITANLDQLNDANISTITISDNGRISASVAQLTRDATAIGKLQNSNPSPVLLAINDTAQAVQAGLSTLVADATEIASITASNGPVVVSTSTFLVDQSTLDQIVGGFDISDAAAVITANLDLLNDPNIDAITISDSGQVGASVQQLATDATTIGELKNASSSPVLLAISDSAGNIEAGLSTLVADTGEIASITASNGPVVVSTATFLADHPTLDKIGGGFAISDTAADVGANLNALSGDSQVTSIALTDGGTPILTVSIAEALNDTRALSEITSPHTTALADTAADIEFIASTEAGALKTDGYTSIASTTGAVAMTITEAETLSVDGIAVTGAPVTASGTVAAMAALATTEASTLVGQGYILAVLDTAADIRAMTVAQINALSARDVTQINASDTTVLLSPLQVAALEAGAMKVSAPPGDAVLISGIAANLEALTASQIGGLPAIGVTGLVSTNANVSYTSAQTAAILSSGLNVSAAGSYTVTENFANGNYSVYQGGQLIRQKSVNGDGSYDIAYFDVTGQTYSSYEGIYNKAAAYVATAQDNVNGSGNLLLYANGLTMTSASGSESVTTSATTGSDTFAVSSHTVETTTIQNSHSNETFVYGPGFGQDTITGFLAPTSAGHDHLQFSASMFGFSSTATQTADAQALLSNFASGTANTTITDLPGDTLTLTGVTIATLQANLADFKFT